MTDALSMTLDCQIERVRQLSAQIRERCENDGDCTLTDLADADALDAVLDELERAGGIIHCSGGENR